MPDNDSSRDQILRDYLRQQVMLSGFLYTLVEDWEIVEEALQETAVYVCSRWEDFTPGTNFGAWVRTVAKMRCREVIQRRRRSAAPSLDTIKTDVAEAISPDEWSEHGRFTPQQKQALAQCLETLPEQHRRILEMHYMEQQNCDRIAVYFQRTIESTYMLLTRIRKRLKQCVNERLA